MSVVLFNLYNMAEHNELGKNGEDYAYEYLLKKGFDILDRNWRPPERELQGDLDLVARLDDLIVFCEVKARRSDDFGGAAAAVGTRKRQQVRRLAESWLRERTPGEIDVRFDVIAIDGVAVTHYAAAF